MSANDLDDEDEPGFFRRNLVLIIVGSLVLAGAGYFAMNSKPSKETKPKKKMEMVMVMPILPPPPPPPPPPPKKEEPPPEEKTEEKMEQPEEEPAEKPDNKPDAPKDEPLGTALTGNGPGDGLSIGGGSGGRGGMGGIGGKTGSGWGWYQGVVKSRIESALRQNNTTKSAEGSVIVKIWLDSTGRISKAVLSDSTGDPTVDKAIQSALSGLNLNELPPDPPKPMPMKLRIALSQPSN